MAFIIENTGSGNYEACPAGMHLARCYQVIDLGTQKEEYQGEVKFLRKIRIDWEIHGTDDDGNSIKMKDGRPFSVKKEYTRTWADTGNLKKDLQSWRNKPFTPEEQNKFEIDNIVNAWCMLNVTQSTSKKGKIYSKIIGVSPVPSVIKQAGFPPAVNQNVIFDFNDPKMDMFNKINKYVQQTIKESPQWERLPQSLKDLAITSDSAPEASIADDTDSDIPF